MRITNHPIWTTPAPTTKAKVSKFKKPLHLIRIGLARQYTRLFPRSMFIGITGSVGKTTTTIAAALVLSQKYRVLCTQPNLDPIFNLPITILKIRPTIRRVVLEMGIEYPGEMDFYLSLVSPATAIVTSVGFQHSEHLGNLDNIACEKGKLVEQLPSSGKAILNYDDIKVREMAKKTNAEVIFIGKDSTKCQVWASNIKIEHYKTSFEINYGVESVRVEYPLLGEHQIYSALSAAALGLSEGISLIKIKNALEQMSQPEHRLEPVLGFNGSIILDDSYNGSPLSIEAALDVLQKLPARRRIVVLGETKQLGRFSEDIHRKIAQRIFNDRIDLVFLGTGDTKYIAEELITLGFLPDRLESGLQNPQIVSKLLKVLTKGDICLIKGSRSLRLDEVVSRVSKKT